MSDVARRPRLSTNQRPRNYLTHTDTHIHREKINILSGPALRAAPAKILKLALSLKSLKDTHNDFEFVINHMCLNHIRSCEQMLVCPKQTY